MISRKSKRAQRKRKKRKKGKNAFSREFEIFSASNKHERAHSHRLFNAANSAEEISREWRHLNNRVIERARSERFFWNIRTAIEEGKRNAFQRAHWNNEKVCMHPLIACTPRESKFRGENSVECWTRNKTENREKINWETRGWCVDVVKKFQLKYLRIIAILKMQGARILKLALNNEKNNWSSSSDCQSRLIKVPFKYSESLFRLFERELLLSSLIGIRAVE